MNGRIFLLDGDNLRPMDEQPYDSEDLLQRKGALKTLLETLGWMVERMRAA